MNEERESPWEQSKPTTKKEKIPIIEKSIVNKLFFSAISIGLLMVVSLSVLAIWDYIADDIAWKAFSTLLVLMGATFVFSTINVQCGRDA